MINGNVIVDGELTGSAEERLLAVVCDGVNSCNGSHEAADVAACSLRIAHLDKQDPFSFCSALLWADEVVKTKQLEKLELSGIKTTIAALYIDSDSFLAYNAGDTRIYQLDGGVLKQLSVDHSLEDEMQTSEKADGLGLPSNSNRVTHYLGSDQSHLRFHITGDIATTTSCGTFVLCSDGAYAGVPDSKLSAVLSCPSLTLPEKGRLFYALAEANNPSDNISIVLINIGCASQVGLDLH